ncbi:DUF6147 family protein [Gracilibacillus sp. S3-1-1]|uniref:DUF6147 family protein n=1 Tax=Gracilibacillus pellucidus TaxID=3095368 RepID=A0ACC6M6L1_9BACI|nr:DUF6147 family protein [Gracilibacillus sp. S3-1-1]MDX8046407.1 DUF6147 family protein [Gracilibacillus sp. S3-1-1]
MKWVRSSLVSSCILIIGFLLFSVDVDASIEDSPQVTTEIMDTQSSKYIKNGNASFSKVDAKTAGARCNTSSYSSVQQISCSIHLQVKNKATGAWVNTGNSKRFTERNSSFVSGSVNFKIEKNYEYRIHTVHTILKDTKSEQLYAVTNAIKF